MPIVYNKRGSFPSTAIYVGRPTKWGNPFPVRGHTVKSHTTAVEKYKDYLKKHLELVEQAKLELRGKDLICWCAPLPCHAEVLLEIANK